MMALKALSVTSTTEVNQRKPGTCQSVKVIKEITATAAAEAIVFAALPHLQASWDQGTLRGHSQSISEVL